MTDSHRESWDLTGCDHLDRGHLLHNPSSASVYYVQHKEERGLVTIRLLWGNAMPKATYRRKLLTGDSLTLSGDEAMTIMAENMAVGRQA